MANYAAYMLKNGGEAPGQDAIGASWTFGGYHNSFVIFPVARTRPYINNYI